MVLRLRDLETVASDGILSSQCLQLVSLLLAVPLIKRTVVAHSVCGAKLRVAWHATMCCIAHKCITDARVMLALSART